MSRHLPVLLTAIEAEKLLSAARAAADAAGTHVKQRAAWRDFVMMQVGLLAGGRVAELCALEVSNIDLVGASLSIVGGKGDKDRNVPIGKKLLPVLREWIGERTSGPLFPGPGGRPLNPRTFQGRLAKLARSVGIVKAVHPHLMRHFFACALLRTGADITEVQELLGHAKLATTAIYLHCEQSRLKPAVDRL